MFFTFQKVCVKGFKHSFKIHLMVMSWRAPEKEKSLVFQLLGLCSCEAAECIKELKQSCRSAVRKRWCLLPSPRSEGGQWWPLATASLEATGISCHTLAFGFKPAPFEVTFEEQTQRRMWLLSARIKKHFTHRRARVWTAGGRKTIRWTDVGPVF